MEIIILKIAACSGLLIGFYYLFLAAERTFKFNRIYLLISLVFAYCVPFIPFNLPFPKNSPANLIFGESAPNVAEVSSVVNPTFDFVQIFVWFYVAISGVLFGRFLYSLMKIVFFKGENRIYKNQKLLITEKEITPFIFFNTIFLSRKNFIDNEIDERIFLHEKCHIQEKHSLDILFLEFIKIFSWINPALYFYKKAMISNHEFLADEYVLKNNFNISNYQHLILNEIKSSQGFNLTHQFNFNTTKKRFIMMTTKNSRLAGVKKIVLLPILAVLFVSFTKEKNLEKAPVPAEIQKSQNVAVSETDIAGLENIPEKFKYISEKSTVKSDTLRKDKKIAEEKPLSPPPPPPPPSPKPDETVDTLPIYPGGINEFRALVSKNFDTSILAGEEGLMKATIYFTIDENGNVSNFGSEGENAKFKTEALRSIKVSNVEKMWKPATKDGQNVKYEFRMPLTMYFAK